MNLTDLPHQPYLFEFLTHYAPNVALILHVQAIQAFHLENIFQLETMAYQLTLQAKLKYNLRGFMPWTHGNKYGEVNVLLLSYAKPRNALYGLCVC